MIELQRFDSQIRILRLKSNDFRDSEIQELTKHSDKAIEY